MSAGVVAALVVASALAACSEPAAPAAGPTRSVVDATGATVTVPASPERVVVLSEPTLDGTLALGVTPVGAVTGRGQSTLPAYLAEQADGVALLGGVGQPNLEAIGAARPDLVLVDGTSINNNPPLLAALAKIAPTVFTGYAGGDWRANLRVTAEALGRDAEPVLDSYDARVAEVREAIGDRSDETFSIVRWQGASAALILTELPPGVALTDLGLRRPAGQDQPGRGHSEPVALENIADIDADWMFFGTLGGASADAPTSTGTADLAGAAAALAEAERSPGFTDLGAFRAGNIVLVDGSRWTSTGGPILMRGIVDDVAAALTPTAPTEDS